MGRLYDAYVEVGPRFAGFGDIKTQGQKAGREYAKALVDAAEKAAKADARRIGEALAKARAAEADAAGKVRVAEEKLNEVRASGKAKTSAIAAAEEALAAAQRKSAAAADTTKAATEELGKAQKRVSDLAESAGKKSGNRFSNAFRSGLSKMGGDKEGKQFATRFGVGMNGAIGGIVSRSAGIFAAGFASIKIGGFLKDAIGSASDLNETMSKTQQIFGPAAKDIVSFSKTSATALGQTQQAALDANATFGIFGKSAGLKGKDLTGFTTKLTTLAGDLASFNNTSPEQAIEAIGAALRGETEPIRAYGVLLDDASLRQEALRQGLVKTTKTALTPQQKVLAAQSLILKQTTAAQGDFARTSGGLANQQRILSARFADFKASLGAVALPLAVKFFGFLNTTAFPALSKVKDGVSAMGEAFKGEGVTSDGFVGALERVGVAARTAFDFFKTEVLPRLKEFGSFVLTSVLPALGKLGANLVSTFGPAVKDVFGFIKTEVLPRLKDFGSFLGDKIGPSLSSMATSLSKNKDFLVPFAATIVTLIAGLKAWAIVQAVLNAELFANPIGLVVLAIAGLVGGLIYAYKHSETFRDVVNKVFTAVKDTFLGFANTAKAAIGVAVTAFDAVKSAVSTVIGFVKNHWKELLPLILGPIIGIPLFIALHWAKVKEVFMAGVSAVLGALKTAWGAVVGVISGPLNAVIGVLTAIWSRVSPILVLPFYIAKSVIVSTFTGIQVVFSTVAGWVTGAFAKAWSAVAGVLSGPINLAKSAISTAWSGISTAFTAAKNWVTGAFSKAWSAVKAVLAGPVNLAKSALDTAWSGIKTAFNAVKNFATGAFSKAWSALKTIITTPVSLAVKALTTILGAGKNGVQWVFSRAVAGISTIWNKLQGLAKAPIKFIVNTVLNGGLIAGFNWIADKFQAPQIKPIPLPKGFAQGGKIPGRPSDVDNTFGFHKGGAIPLATGEFIVNARQTAKNLPLLKAINAGAGYADGGLFGSLKNAVGSAYTKGKNFVGDVADFTKDAAGWFKNKFKGPLSQMDQLGNSSIAQIVTAVPRKIADTIVGKSKDLLKGLFTAGSGPNTPVGKVVSFRGELLNQRTIAMLLSAEAALRRTFHIMQGSYSTRVSASGSTHAGGGAMDTDNAGAGWDRAVSALRAAGFAAWHRTPSQGPWGHHIHSIAIGDPTASPAAKAQVRDFQHGGDGLGGMVKGGRIGSYAGGAWKILYDQLAMVHKDEMVVPKESAGYLRKLLPALPNLGTGKIRSQLHRLHAAHSAHLAHVGHLNHLNTVGRIPTRSQVGADLSGNGVTGGTVRLHPDDINELARRLAGENAANPPQVYLDSRKVDNAMSRSALGRGY